MLEHEEEYEKEQELDDLRYNWEDKASEILRDIDDQYLLFSESIDFSNVENAFKIKNKILKLYDRYMDFAREQPEELGIGYEEYRKYMRNNLSAETFAAMPNRQGLENNLSEIIQKNRPEYKRKMQIFKDIMDYVSSADGVYRADICRAVQSGNDKEVMACYRDLVKKNRLVEIKLGNRLFVYLSDAEKEKNNKMVLKQDDMPSL